MIVKNQFSLYLIYKLFWKIVIRQFFSFLKYSYKNYDAYEKRKNKY